jgi:acetylornithine/N-succinyldiaminopimelate aminotransferase
MEKIMTMPGTALSFNNISKKENDYQLATYTKWPIAAEHGEGVWLYTSDNERYMDLYGGHAVCATGHCHPHVVAAISEQAKQLIFYSNMVYSNIRARAAEKLVNVAPKQLTKAFFCNSGTEANENAMRLARMFTKRERILTFSGSFHGRTADSISATGLGKYRELGRPNVPGHVFAEFGDIKSVEKISDDTVAAIMLEPIQSMAGMRMCEPQFYKDLRALCDERGIVLIFDEVQTGIGRTGEWFFAESKASGGTVPDIITLAKALGSGVPVGACLTTDAIASSIKENDLGTTFGGGMLAMAAVLATLEAIETDAMIDNARAIGKYLREEMSSIDQVKNVRGCGLLLGIEFKTAISSAVQKSLLDKKIITGTSSDPHVLRLLPPLCLKQEEVNLFIEALRESLTAI